MAEILGAVSSVAGLLGTAITLVQEVQKARNRINGSSKTLEDITKELANLYSTLTLVKEESKLQTSSVIQQVETIIGVGNELKAFFDSLLLEQQRKQIKQFFRAIKSGDDNDKELAAILGRLDRAKAELGLRISLAQISLIGNLHDGYNVSLGVLQDLNNSVKKIAGPHSQIAGELEAKKSDASADGSVLLDKIDIDNLTLVSVDEHERVKDGPSVDSSKAAISNDEEDYEFDDKDRECLFDLRLTDPGEDINRIEGNKDKLLDSSYTWILENETFIDWQRNKNRSVLWIKGDPGKGKTMLMIGLVRKLLAENPDKSQVFSFFFCEASEPRSNNPVAILRGLLFSLVSQRKSLIRHIRKKYDISGKQLFEDVNAFYGLSSIISNILEDPASPVVYFVVDALDECVVGLDKILDLISQQKFSSSRVKWLVTSRGWQMIEERLKPNDFRLMISLENNPSHISKAVSDFISSKTSDLANQKGYDENLRTEVKDYLEQNSEGTFLWVSLVCKELAKVRRSKTSSALKAFPRGLEPLYERMMGQVLDLEDRDDVGLCKSILSVVALTFRPLHVNELTAIGGLPDDLCDDLESLYELINLCAAFVDIREGTVHFVHQSAKDYFTTGKGFSRVIYTTLEAEHYAIADRSLELLKSTLKQDICELGNLSIIIKDLEDNVAIKDLGSRIGYACCYWIHHLKHSGTKTLEDAYKFLLEHFLHWLEALSLTKSLSNAATAMFYLENLASGTDETDLFNFVHDGRRFLSYHGPLIRTTPLQIYYSALLFSPSESTVRRSFEIYLPKWIQGTPMSPKHWNSCLQTLREHSESINALAFSPRGGLLVSVDQDHILSFWKSDSGGWSLQALHSPRIKRKGDRYHSSIIAFSPDGELFAAVTGDDTVIWKENAGSWTQCSILPVLDDKLNCFVFSPNSYILACGYRNSQVVLWDLRTESPTPWKVIECREASVEHLSFSSDGILVSTTEKGDVQFWKEVDGVWTDQMTTKYREVYYSKPSDIAISPNGSYFATLTAWEILRVWNVENSKLVHESMRGYLWRKASRGLYFSHDSQMLVMAAPFGLEVIEVATMTTKFILNDHPAFINKISISTDSLIACAYSNGTIMLWDVGSDSNEDERLHHTAAIEEVIFSPDGRFLASLSQDFPTKTLGATTGQEPITSAKPLHPSAERKHYTTKIWDSTTGDELYHMAGKHAAIRTKIPSIPFTTKEHFVSTTSSENYIENWILNRTFQEALDAHLDVSTVVLTYSPDRHFIFVTKLDPETYIKDEAELYDTEDWHRIATFKTSSEGGLDEHTPRAIFSWDSRLLFILTSDHDIIIQDLETGRHLVSLVHQQRLPLQFQNFIISGDIRWVASTITSANGLTRIIYWELNEALNPYAAGGSISAEEFTVLQCHGYSALSFSPDSRILASAFDNIIQLWDVATRALVASISINARFESLNFITIPSGASFLRTNVGLFHFNEPQQYVQKNILDTRKNMDKHTRKEIQKPPPPPPPVLSECVAITLENWVTINGEKCIWIPSEYSIGERGRFWHDSSVAVRGDGTVSIAMGCETGRVVILNLDPMKFPGYTK